jgi:hypothetical protein
MHGRKKWLVLIAATGAAGFVQQVIPFPHYTAPFTCVLLILIVAGGRALWYRTAALRMRGPLTGVAMAVLLTFVVVDYASALHPPPPSDRTRLIRQLQSMGGRHLVFVNYLVDQYAEWVYNSADLETSPVIFAQMRPGENQKLMDRFPGRTAWLVTIGPQPSEVRWEPYPR